MGTLGFLGTAAAAGAMHAALWFNWQTEGGHRRWWQRFALRIWWVVVVSVAATALLQVSEYPAVADRPVASLFAIIALAGLTGVRTLGRQGLQLGAFLCSGVFLTGALASLASGFFPEVATAGVGLMSLWGAAFLLAATSLFAAKHSLREDRYMVRELATATKGSEPTQ